MSKISAHFKLKKRKRQDNETETVTLDSTDDESTSVAADLSVLYFKKRFFRIDSILISAKTKFRIASHRILILRDVSILFDSHYFLKKRVPSHRFDSHREKRSQVRALLDTLYSELVSDKN